MATRAERIAIGRRRLVRVLSSHGIACLRTLEQKISDAGPGHLRIDPHLLTEARRGLEAEGVIAKTQEGIGWYYLTSTPSKIVRQRLDAQLHVYQRISRGSFSTRLGQTLEIAVHRALLAQDGLQHFGAFTDLNQHDDSLPYSKEEPPRTLSGRRVPRNLSLDFLVSTTDGHYAGLEVKNVREWFYPDRGEVKALLLKACALDVVPVLICRRYAYVTFSVLNRCGLLLHQTFNQLYPMADEDLAASARDKRLLGYHDIRVGNTPDARLVRFVGTHLPKLIGPAREKFIK